MFGQRGLSTEVRYRGGHLWREGELLDYTVKLDVLEGLLDAPTCVYDYKFWGNALSQSRIDEIRRVARLADSVPVIEVKPR